MQKRRAAKAEAAENVDLFARLAPHFPPPAAHLIARPDEIQPTVENGV
jgi:hypothetical protein